MDDCLFRIFDGLWVGRDQFEGDLQEPGQLIAIRQYPCFYLSDNHTERHEGRRSRHPFAAKARRTGVGVVQVDKHQPRRKPSSIIVCCGLLVQITLAPLAVDRADLDANGACDAPGDSLIDVTLNCYGYGDCACRGHLTALQTTAIVGLGPVSYKGQALQEVGGLPLASS